MKLIFAQGNPEARYDGTRHNVGFWLLDNYASTQGASWRDSPKHKAMVAEVAVNGEKILLVKPTTYYNETGQAARLLIDFYKLDPASDLLVLHDDIALPLGTIRVRQRGSDGGNNGIKSLSAHLGEQYWRLRIGVWSPLRDRMPDVDFVLGKFNADERQILIDVAELVQDTLTRFTVGSLASYSQSIPPSVQ